MLVSCTRKPLPSVKFIVGVIRVKPSERSETNTRSVVFVVDSSGMGHSSEEYLGSSELSAEYRSGLTIPVSYDKDLVDTRVRFHSMDSVVNGEAKFFIGTGPELQREYSK
jgi:hypothetical protein